jgi:hypothetical protein
MGPGLSAAMIAALSLLLGALVHILSYAQKDAAFALY